MARGRRHTDKEIVHVLRQIEADAARGMKTQLACYEAGISEQTYYRWYTEYVNLTIDQANCLKALQESLLKPAKMPSEAKQAVLTQSPFGNDNKKSECKNEA